MSNKPIATVGSNHICPMCSGTVPHVGGPVIQGEATVLIEGKQAATVGSICTCVGMPDMIVTGVSNVLIGNKPVATVGSLTAHGGNIVQGANSVLIGTGCSAPTAVMSIPEIPFPKLKVKDILGAAATGNSQKLKKAQETQQQIKNLAQKNTGKPHIYNLMWEKEQSLVRESRNFKQVTLKASVANIEDGETICFKVKKPTINNNTKQLEDFIELSGTVQNKQVTVVWEIEVPQEKDVDSTLTTNQ